MVPVQTSKLPSLLNSINLIDLFSTDTSNDDHFTVLTKFTTNLILSINASLIKLNFNEVTLFQQATRIPQRKDTLLFITNTMSLIDTLLRFGQSSHTPSSEVFIRTTLTISSSLLTPDPIVFDICKSTISFLKCATNLADDVIEVLLDLLSSATATLEHAKTSFRCCCCLFLDFCHCSPHPLHP